MKFTQISFPYGFHTIHPQYWGNRSHEEYYVGVWKSGKPESGIGTGIGTGTGTGTGIGTGMERKTYIKIGTTFTLI